MDHMVTLTMVPDALVLEKGIGWVWLQMSTLGWDGLHCTFCTFVCCLQHCQLIMFASSSCLLLHPLNLFFALYLFLYVFWLDLCSLLFFGGRGAVFAIMSCF